MRADFIIQDSSEVSNFIIDNSTTDWFRVTNVNNLTFCLALDFVSLNVIAPLPSDFELNLAWKKRLLDIINTNNHSTSTKGICGVCFLQSFQIIAELLENPAQPRYSGGYFFISFALRNSLLYEVLNNISECFPTFIPAESQATTQMNFEYSNNLALMSVISMLSQYEWSIIVNSGSPHQVPNVVDGIFTLARSSAVILPLWLVDKNAEDENYAMIALRMHRDVVLVPTNVQMKRKELNEYTRVRTNRYKFFDAFEEFGFSNIAPLEADFCTQICMRIS